jgi:hypothetical protein
MMRETIMKYRQPRDDEYTEEIQFGDLRWKTTPERKACWNSFWSKILAAVEKDCYTDVQDDAKAF